MEKAAKQSQSDHASPRIRLPVQDRAVSRDGFAAPPAIAPSTAQFLRRAAALAAIAPSLAGTPEHQARLEEFLQIYRSWIIQQRGMADAPEAWAERSAILLHLMIGASTLGEAIEIYIRFSHRIWGVRTRFELASQSGRTLIIFHEADRAGPEGLVCSLWPLATTLAQLEFLSGGPLDGVSGQTRNAQSLPRSTTNLLFGRPLTFEADVTALIIPEAELRRAVVVRAANVPAFLQNFMQIVVGMRGRANEMRALVSTLICNDILCGAKAPTNMPDVVRRLGLSVATARRRLHEEGATFREIKEEVLDQLAKMWLRETKRPIESIAENLGYSDNHAFRRAFQRRNFVPPSVFRNRAE